MYVLANNSNVCVGKQFCLSCTNVIFHAILSLFFFFITFQYEIVGNVFHWHTLHLQYRWSILDNAYAPNEFFFLFTVKPYHNQLFIVIFLLDLLAFFIANPLFRDRGKFVYSADNYLILRTNPLRLSFAFVNSCLFAFMDDDSKLPIVI